MTDPAELAKLTVQKIMSTGSEKDGRDESWRDKDRRYHLLKAIRHFTTELLILDGHQSPGDEDHLENGITRGTMALAARPVHVIKHIQPKTVSRDIHAILLVCAGCTILGLSFYFQSLGDGWLEKIALCVP